MFWLTVNIRLATHRGQGFLVSLHKPSIVTPLSFLIDCFGGSVHFSLDQVALVRKTDDGIRTWKTLPVACDWFVTKLKKWHFPYRNSTKDSWTTSQLWWLFSCLHRWRQDCIFFLAALCIPNASLKLSDLIRFPAFLLWSSFQYQWRLTTLSIRT